MAQENSIAVTENLDEGTITWETAVGAVSLNVRELQTTNPEIFFRLALHGAKQKGTDSYAGARAAVEKGEAVSRDAYAHECVSEVVSNLTSGVWSQRREGSGAPRSSMLARAVAEVLSIDLADAVARLVAMSDEGKKKVAGNPQVARVVLRLRREAEEKRAADLERQIAAGGEGADLRSLLAG